MLFRSGIAAGNAEQIRNGYKFGIQRIPLALYNIEVPTIAAVNGPAIGAGCDLACFCDIRIASEKATFGLPEINVGRCGGGAHMGRLVPPGLLRLMVFTGEPISAWEAHRVGLVEQLVNAKRLRPAAMELAQTIAAKSPIEIGRAHV